MEVTIGANIARKEELKIGSVFFGTHGEVKKGHLHGEHHYTVVGILEKTNTVLDHLILTNIESVWQVHSNHDSHQHPIDTLHALALNLDHNHNHQHNHTKHVVTADSLEITAVLLKYKSKRSMLSMPRIINEQTNMQAVIPNLEINRLFYMLGVGMTTLKLIDGGVMLMAGFSVFFVLFSRLRDRKHELALMRSVGYRPRHLFGLLILEGLLLTATGYILGWLLSRFGIYFINLRAENDFNLQFGGDWVEGEGWLLLLTFLVGLVSALIPAWRAMQLDISTILSKSRT